MDYNKRKQIEELSSIIFDMKKHAEKLETMAHEETDREFKSRLIRIREIADQAYMRCVWAVTKLEQDEFNN